LLAATKILPSGRAKALSSRISECCELDLSALKNYRGKRLMGVVRARKLEGLGAPPSFDGKNSKLLTGSVLEKRVPSCIPPRIICIARCNS